MKTQIFLHLNSPQSLPFLQTLIELNTHPLLYYFQVTLIGDLNNETQKQIIFSFIYTVETLGARSAILYLQDGLQTDFKSAFRRTRPNIKWEQIPELYDLSVPTARIVHEGIEFAKHYGINDFMIFVNNEPIEGYPIFNKFIQSYDNAVYRLMDDVKNGLLKWENDVEEWLFKRGLKLDYYPSPLNITRNNLLFIDHLDIDIIYQLIGSLFPKDNPQTIVPIFYFDTQKVPKLEHDDSLPPFEIFNFDSEDIPVSLHDHLRIGQKPVTIVGSYFFDKELSADELRYALKHLTVSYLHGVDNLTQKQLFYILLWRATNQYYSIQRQIEPNVQSPLIIDASQPNSFLRWRIHIDPFSSKFLFTSHMMNLAYQNKIASIVFLPTPQLYDYKDVPKQLFNIFLPSVVFSTIEIPTPLAEIITPDYWIAEQNHTHALVQGIVQFGILSHQSIIQINDKRYASLSSGEFMPILPIGIHQTIGTNPPYFKVTSFLPRSQFFFLTYSIIQIPTDNYLNVLTFVTDSSFENFTRLAISSLLKSCSKPVRFWIIGKFLKPLPNDINVNYIPFYIPFFLPQTDDPYQKPNSIKLILPDLIFPPEVKFVLFSEQSLVWVNDAAIFEKLNMSKISIALPQKRGKNGNNHWEWRDFRLKRFDRPYHSVTLFYLNMDEWRNQKAGDAFRSLYSEKLKKNIWIPPLDEDILNINQLSIQVLTLSPNTVLDEHFEKPNDLKKAVAVFQNEQTILHYLGKKLSNAQQENYDEMMK